MKFDFSSNKVLVIGDLMIDHYIIGESNRMSPEAPVPVVVPIKKYSVPGGAGNVALNLAAMKAKVSCIGVIGNDNWGKELISLLDGNIDVSNIIISEPLTTTLKQRTYLQGKQILRVDEEEQLDSSYDIKVNSLVNDILYKFDIIILSDYNKGLLNKNTITHILNIANKHNIPVIVDPKKSNFSYYNGANILTPNLNELSKASKITITDDESIIKSCQNLIKDNRFKYIVTTKGENGMIIVGKDLIKKIEPYKIKSPDVTGAGDTVVSLLALMYSNTKNIEVSANIANIAAAFTVSKAGTTCCSLSDLERIFNKKNWNYSQ
jgi:rfaE bifunctional protein kinase chain/domain